MLGGSNAKWLQWLWIFRHRILRPSVVFPQQLMPMSLPVDLVQAMQPTSEGCFLGGHNHQLCPGGTWLKHRVLCSRPDLPQATIPIFSYDSWPKHPGHHRNFCPVILGQAPHPTFEACHPAGHDRIFFSELLGSSTASYVRGLSFCRPLPPIFFPVVLGSSAGSYI